MGLEISIQDIQERTEAKYGTVTVSLGEAGNAVLQHMIRLPKPKREKFSEKTQELNKLHGEVAKMQKAAQAATEDDDTEAPEFDMDGLQTRMNGLIGELLTIVCVDPKTARVLLESLPEFADRMTLFQVYMENAQPGEASPSPS